MTTVTQARFCGLVTRQLVPFSRKKELSGRHGPLWELGDLRLPHSLAANPVERRPCRLFTRAAAPMDPQSRSVNGWPPRGSE